MRYQWFLLGLTIILCIYLLKGQVKDKMPLSSGVTEKDQTTPNFLDQKSSIVPTSSKVPVKQLKKRKIKGEIPANVDLNSLPFENEINELWTERLKEKLMAQIAESSVKLKSITPIDSYIKITNGKARYYETVLIQMEKENSPDSSFKAEVDSETGEVLKTWDLPIFEHFNRHLKNHAHHHDSDEVR